MNQISIYVHWPFCLSLCPYCDFNSHLSNSIDHEAWIRGYESELEFFANKLKGHFVKSIFFGGGTPSLMKPAIVEGIIQKVSNLGLVNETTEITIEANPTSYEIPKFVEFKSAGINRVSIGVQSFNPQSLELLGRKYSAKEAINAIESAAKLFDKYSFDLIYALPEQDLKQWQEEMIFALSLAKSHISLYQLTIEKGTPFYKLFNDGKMQLPSSDAAANMYEWTNQYLHQKKYTRYEISNYAKDGHECIHNLCYWNYDEYIGVGPGAHSRLHENNNINAVMMIHKPEKWLQKVLKNGNGIQTQTQLSKHEIIEECFMMGTRLEKGLLESDFHRITGKYFSDILNPETIKHHINQDLVYIEDNRLFLTNKGLMLHDYLIPRMLV